MSEYKVYCNACGSETRHAHVWGTHSTSPVTIHRVSPSEAVTGRMDWDLFQCEECGFPVLRQAFDRNETRELPDQPLPDTAYELPVNHLPLREPKILLRGLHRHLQMAVAEYRIVREAEWSRRPPATFGEDSMDGTAQREYMDLVGALIASTSEEIRLSDKARLLLLVLELEEKRRAAAAGYDLPTDEEGLELSREQMLELGKYDLVLEAVELSIVDGLLGNTSEMAERCVELSGLYFKGDPTEAVLRFLRRLSGCYVNGFFPECIILCRAVLENAINDTFRRKGSDFPATGKGKSEMAAKIRWAGMNRWLSPEGEQQSVTIWKRGSKAVHEDPLATEQALETIEMTMDVVGQLYAA